MPKKEENPFKMGYDPEFDTSPELDPDVASFYLTMRIDIITKVSLLSFHRALPREGYLEASVHDMAHFGQK